MATRASDPLFYMNAVIEICKIREAVHLIPLNGLSRTVTLAHGLEVSTIGIKDGMAIHTGLRWRNTSHCRSLNTCVAIPAVNPVIADMVLMTELYRLLLRDVLIRGVRRARYCGRDRER